MSDNIAPKVEIIDNPTDIAIAYRCACDAFGRQARDAFWDVANPGWETPAGEAAGAQRMIERWAATQADNKGNASAVFLKATLPDPDGPGGRPRVLAGFAIWVQATAVAGFGEVVSDDPMDAEAMYPGDETEQRFLRQMTRSFLRQRVELVRSKARDDPPAVMVLDHCVTDPRFQRCGVATALARWGLDEARRRGIPDLAMEASRVGRLVYARLGFRPVGKDVVFEVDEEFAGRKTTAVLFMVYSGGAG